MIVSCEHTPSVGVSSAVGKKERERGVCSGGGIAGHPALTAIEPFLRVGPEDVGLVCSGGPP